MQVTRKHMVRTEIILGGRMEHGAVPSHCPHVIILQHMPQDGKKGGWQHWFHCSVKLAVRVKTEYYVASISTAHLNSDQKCIVQIQMLGKQGCAQTHYRDVVRRSPQSLIILLWWEGGSTDPCTDAAMLLFIFTSVNFFFIFLIVASFSGKLLLGSYKLPSSLTEQQMLFHFNSEKQFAACSAVTIGALSITRLGLTLLDISNMLCFLKSKVLITLHCQRLSLDDPFPSSLPPPSTPRVFHSGESTFFREQLSSLKDAFLPLFYQMKAQGRPLVVAQEAG